MKQKMILTGLALTLALTACKKEEKADSAPQNTVIEEMQEKDGVRRMPESYLSGKTSLGGHTYEYSIHRYPDTELPKLEDEDGKVYYDNRIDVKVTRDGGEFYEHTFRKSSFESHLTNDFIKKGTLEGLVYEKTEADGLHFAASVSYPMSDMYIPMIVILDTNGGITIKQDTNMDADIPNPQEDVEDEDGV